MSSVRFLGEALAELAAVADWYAQQSPTAGEELVKLIEDAVAAIAELPEAWPRWKSLDVRARALRRFPYLVVYAVRNDEVVIVAIAHTSRRPGYWLERVPR